MSGKTENKLKQRLMEKNKSTEASKVTTPIFMHDSNDHAELFKKLKESTSEKIAERLEKDNKKTVYRININNLVGAPEDWNYFSPLSDDKMIELVDSIKSIGLQSPVVVWELPQESGEDQKYLILSGHNRTRAYKEIYEKENNEDYLFIPCIIYLHHELSEQDAKDIIIDSNYVNRVLTAREKTLSVKHKYLLYKSQKEKYAMDKVAKDLNLKLRTIKYYLAVNQLEDEIKELVFTDILAMRDAAKLAKLPSETQRWLIENHKEKITSELCRNVKTSMSIGEMENLLSSKSDDKEHDGEEGSYVTLTFRVQASMEEELKKLVEEWIIQRQNN